MLYNCRNAHRMSDGRTFQVPKNFVWNNVLSYYLAKIYLKLGHSVRILVTLRNKTAQWRDGMRRGNFEQQLKKHPRWDQVEVACYIYARRNYTTFRYPQKLPLPPSATSKWARAWVILSPRKTNDKTAVHNYSCARAMLSKISFHNRHSLFVCAPSR